MTESPAVLPEMSSDSPELPRKHRSPISKILETALYVADLDASEAFYTDVLGFTKQLGDNRMRGMAIPGGQVLLLFKKGGSTKGEATPGGFIPPHDGSGNLHVAFAIEELSLGAWLLHLEAENVRVESMVCPEKGGTSVYFRDPDGHAIEIATPGIWPNY